jgi:hypothetical protein
VGLSASASFDADFSVATAQPNAAAVFLRLEDGVPARPDSDAIDSFIAENGITKCPAKRSGRPRRHGGPARKAGERYPNGQLKWRAAPPDKGHEMTLAHRADQVGEANAADPMAGYVLGQLFLLGALTDPKDPDRDRASQDARRRHDTLVGYAAKHHFIWGDPEKVPSHLGNLMAGMRAPPSPTAEESNEERTLKIADSFGRLEAAAMTTPPCGRLLGIDVLRRATLYGMPITDPRDQATLRRVADRFLEIEGDRRDRRDASPALIPETADRFKEISANSKPPLEGIRIDSEPRRRRSREPLPSNFSRERDGPSRAAVNKSVADLRALMAGRPMGSAD